MLEDEVVLLVNELLPIKPPFLPRFINDEVDFLRFLMLLLEDERERLCSADEFSLLLNSLGGSRSSYNDYMSKLFSWPSSAFEPDSPLSSKIGINRRLRLFSKLKLWL